MRLQIRNPRPSPKLPSPEKAIFHTYRLMDDALWHAINKPAQKIADKMDVHKSTVAVSATAATGVGLVATNTYDFNIVEGVRSLIGCGAFTYALYKQAILSGLSPAEGVASEDMTALQVFRMPMLLGHVGALFQSKNRSELLHRAFWAVFAIGVYLVSSSNGSGKKAMAWLGEKLDSVSALFKTPAREIVPASNFNSAGPN